MAPLAEAFIRIRPLTTGFKAEAESKIGKFKIDVKVGPDVSKLAGELKAKLKTITLPAAKVAVKPDVTGFNAELKAKIAALPAVTTTAKVAVNANTTAAIAALTAVDKLVGKLDGRTVTIRVNASTATALSALAKVATAATALGALTVRIHVSVTGNISALAAIGAVAAAAGALGALNPTVSINTRGAVSGMGALIAAAQIFGTAAVPAIAAASAALVSMTGIALTAGLGLGVAVLALSGVVGAVKALNKAKSEQAKTGALLARQDKALASGADQVRSAIASLANTRANAASTARAAALAIARAEQGVAEAQRDGVRAQKEVLALQQDINRAREEAADSLEDLTSQVANNSLAIRQANLDLADAKKDLDKVIGDPTATQRQRDEAQLTYDRAMQQLKDLGVAQGRLAEEQSAAAKAGIDGSKQVREAQDRVVSAQERAAESQKRIREAEEALKEARVAAAEQARQSAFAITQAQQAVASAQRAVATTAVTAASTAGAAMDDLRARMEKLSPAGRRFAEFLSGMKEPMLALRREAETGFLPGLQDGIQRLMIYLPQLRSFVRDVGEELGSLTRRGAEALAGPEWRAFFTYIRGSATTTLEQLGRTIGNLTLGFANLLVAFLPLQRQFSGGMVDMTKRFAEWTAGLEKNRSFQEFVDYALTRGPAVMSTLRDLGGALLAIAKAAAPVGDVMLAALRGLADIIKAIPTGVLTALVVAFTAMKVAAIVAPMVTALGVALTAVRSGALTASTAMGGLVTVMGGPVAAAVTAATVAIGFLIYQNQKARNSAKELRESFQGFGAALKDGVTPQSLESAEAILRQNKELRGLIGVAKEAGVSQADLVAGLNGDALARGRINDALNTQIARLAELNAVAPFQSTRTAQEILATTEQIKKLKELRDAFNAASTAEERVSIASQYLKLQQDDLTVAMKDGATAADILRRAYDTLNGRAVDRQVALEAERAAYDALRESVERNGPTLDENTAKGRENNRAIRERIQSVQDMAAADIAATGTVGVQTQARIDGMKRELLQLGFTRAEVDRLLETYQKIKPEIVTKIVLAGGGDAIAGLNAIGVAAAQLIATYGITPDQAVIIAKGGLPANWRGPSPSQIAQNKADGGLIHGYSPHARADNIPAMLTAKEFVHPVKTVDYYGVGVMEALRHRRIPKELLSGAEPHYPQYATGGLVSHTAAPKTWPSWGKFNERTTAMTADLQRALAYQAALMNMGAAGAGAAAGPGPGFLPWPSGPGAQRGDTGVWKSIMALVRSSGIPYKFGNSYRPGDPKWHGSGRAVDFMGYNQDALAQFFLQRQSQLLELIHQTPSGGYFVTRGKRKANFPVQGPLHRDHLHVAMASGGLVTRPRQVMPARLFDGGGTDWEPNTLGVNMSGKTETVTTNDGMRRVEELLERQIESQERLIAAVERIAPGVGSELRGTSRDLRLAARARR